MLYSEENKRKLLQLVGKNINYYRYQDNQVHEKGFVTIEKLAEQIDSSPNML